MNKGLLLIASGNWPGCKRVVFQRLAKPWRNLCI